MPDDELPTDEQGRLLHLLELLAAHATVPDVVAVQVPPRARELALRLAQERDAHLAREAALSALLDIARELASESDPAGVLDAIVRRARILLRTDLAYLTVYDPEVGDTYMRATDGSISARFQSVRLALGDGLGGLVASTHKPYWTADYTNDQRFAHTSAIDSAVADEGIIAICGTPLIVESHFVGVLFAANRSPRPFTRDEVSLLGSLAALAAVTLVQTRALAEAEQAVRALSEAHETVRQYAAGVEKAAAAHDRFASLVLQDGGVEGITKSLVELLGGWAVLTDAEGERRSESGPVPQDLGLVTDGNWGSGRLVEVDGTYVAPVSAVRDRLGTLFVGGVEDLSDSDRRTIERAAVVTALVLLFERAVVDSHQHERDRLVSDLISPRGGIDDRLALTRSAGFNAGQPFCLLVIRGDDRATSRSVLLSTSTIAGADALVGAHDGDIVALVPGDDPDGLAKSMAARLGRRAGTTVAGVGPLAGVGGIPDAHAAGVRTVRALLALGRRGMGGAATELGFAGLIVGSEPDIGEYVARVLGPVLDYDERRGTDLAGTLAAYFAAGSSPRYTAGTLHVHVNTVAQRLERITALLGDAWQHPDRALEIQLALRLRDLLLTPG
ncbi:MAG: helix-turn-helix domain-containing protein [Intrasporangium sp.]|uniref:helix-turn-helix domain-containing protein n=1 Tax=Intrasporangium sp. TaxID=1925024 RepID=UPI002647632F|nr:helix-turn-helix domain-containing protein [Intrasporangium sp.]MDN5794515.1 helix-turn-helix domain-containing protein [Intrasporangium sp.]